MLIFSSNVPLTDKQSIVTRKNSEMLGHEQNFVKRCIRRVENEPACIPRPNMGTEQLQPKASHLPIPMWMSKNMQNINPAEYLSRYGA